MNHIFNVVIAEKCGVHAAILLQHIFFWVNKNRADERNEHDGQFWTFNTVKNLCEQFPYLTKDQITYALSKLKQEEYILVGNYNKHKYDRTCWYTVTDKAKSILEKSEMETGTMINGRSQITEPIPNIKTNKNTNSKSQIDYNIFRTEAEMETPYQHMIDGIPTEATIVKWVIEDTSKTIQKYWGRTATSYDVEKFFRKIVKYVENYDGSAFGGIDSDKVALIHYAFELTADSGKTNWNYINGIYDAWEERDLESLRDVIEHEEERSMLKKQKKVLRQYER